MRGSDETKERVNFRLLWVHHDSGTQGRGRALLHSAENRLRGQGVREVRLAGGVPRYLWPGVDVTNLPMQRLAATSGYQMLGTAVNMTMSTNFQADTPTGVDVRRVVTAEGSLVRDLIAGNWPIWLTEFDIALRRGTVFAAWFGDRAIGFFAHSTMRAGWIGPMGTDPECRAKGVGAATLAAVCGDLEQLGYPTAEVAWVGPVGYFADRGAKVTRTFSRFVKRFA